MRLVTGEVSLRCFVEIKWNRAMPSLKGKRIGAMRGKLAYLTSYLPSACFNVPELYTSE
jgi:hypothetical protein